MSKLCRLRTELGRLLLVLCLAFSVCSLTQAQEVTREQYQKLKSNNNALIMKLTALELTLTTLDKPLQEQINELTKCKETLIKLERDLSTINNKLIVSQASLENVRALQKKTEQSLKLLENRVAKYKRQRVYGWVFGVTTAILILAKKS